MREREILGAGLNPSFKLFIMHVAALSRDDPFQKQVNGQQEQFGKGHTQLLQR